MRRPIHDHGNVPRRAANIMTMVGQQKRNVIVTLTTNIRQAHRCTSVNTVLALTRASARAIASSIWRRRTVGPMSDPRTTARPRRVRWAKPRRLLRSQHQVLMRRARNSELHPAHMATVILSAWRHPSTARKIRVLTRPSTPLSWTSMTDSLRLRSTTTHGTSHIKA